MISTIFGTRFNHRKHVKSSSPCSRPPISTTWISLRWVCNTKLHSKTLSVGEKKTQRQHSHAGGWRDMNSHEQTAKVKRKHVWKVATALQGRCLATDRQAIWSYSSPSWNLRQATVGRASILHPASFRLPTFCQEPQGGLASCFKSKNMSARLLGRTILYIVHDKARETSSSCLDSLCCKGAPADSIWVWASYQVRNDEIL